MFYIISNSRTISGGPELCQQLCKTLRENGFRAEMAYFSKYRFPETHLDQKLVDRYKEYNNPIAKKIVDSHENVIIYPETTTFLLKKFKKIRKIIWWMSVDNYFSSLTSPYFNRYDFFNRTKKIDIFNENFIHCCQSYYAVLFLKSHGVKENSILMLSDYTNGKFLEETKDESEFVKENIILYNPKKGIEFTRLLKQKLLTVRWIALENMSHDEMISVLKRSKLYVDFGNHPGKDRIPREAVMSGCCIITGKKGSAGNNIDVPILEEYKFDTDDANIDEIVDKIIDCLDNYENNRKNFDSYRNVIRNEKTTFCNEVQSMATLMTE